MTRILQRASVVEDWHPSENKRVLRVKKIKSIAIVAFMAFASYGTVASSGAQAAAVGRIKTENCGNLATGTTQAPTYIGE